jgi:hypothetical protein
MKKFNENELPAFYEEIKKMNNGEEVVSKEVFLDA